MSMKHILVADDLTDSSRSALEQAIDFAKTFRAKLTIVTVVSPISPGFSIPAPLGDAFDAILTETGKRLAAQRERILALGVPEVETKLYEGDPVDRVVEYAKEHRPDLIVVGSRGLSGAGRFLLGSVSDGILHHVHCSVLVVKGSSTPETKSKS
jgi:nucleotide-binding universal stress UspA family protein